MALMLGWLVANVVKLLCFIVLASEYYLWPRFGLAGLGPLFSFGIYRTLEYTFWIAFTSADVLIISRWLGSTALGIYVVALNFATMPLSKIAPIVNSTAFPAFALVQGRPAEVQFYTAVRFLLPATLPETVRFAALIVVGAMTYGVALFVLFRDLVTEMVRLFHRSPSPVG